VPEIYQKHSQRCRDLHPEWEYKLWNETNIHELPIEDFLFNNIIKEMTGKKDYIEMLALYEIGGVFLDFDAICVEPMDELIYRYSYFSGLEPS
jgi:mannosyltransferase OCH1-like enzyme